MGIKDFWGIIMVDEGNQHYLQESELTVVYTYQSGF